MLGNKEEEITQCREPIHHTHRNIGGDWSSWRTTVAASPRWRGLDRLLVRGLAKVTSMTLLAVLTYNLMRCIRLGWL